MKIGIYTPYLDSFGGGERYMLTIAEILSADHTVDLLLDNHQLMFDTKNLIQSLGKYFNLDLSKISLLSAPIGQGSNFLERVIFFKKYDLIICLTDGSIFHSTARHSLLHFQVPFKNTSTKGLWGKFKLSSWDLAICNSKFTQNIIKKEWPIKSEVLYPPVDTEAIKPLKKKKQIISVGRFTSFSKSKKHEVMIKVFKELYLSGKIPEWSLHLVGSIEGDENYIDELRDLAKGLPVIFYPNCPFKNLIKLYSECSIYWHAAGFKENDPSQMEHFGIATVEAMAGGCVPVVVNGGGQPEIVENKISGFLWNQINELKNYTLTLTEDDTLWKRLSENAIRRSKVFSKKSFKINILKLIQSLNE